MTSVSAGALLATQSPGKFVMHAQQPSVCFFLYFTNDQLEVSIVSFCFTLLKTRIHTLCTGKFASLSSEIKEIARD